MSNISDKRDSILALIDEAFNLWFEKKIDEIRIELAMLTKTNDNLIEWVKQLNKEVKKLQEESK